MLVLSELDLQLAFERRGALSEDVEDQSVAIENADLQSELELAFLPRAQRLVDENQIRLSLARARGDLFDLAAADEEFGVRTIPPCKDFADDTRARGFRECAEFLEFVVETRSGQADVQ